MKLFAAFATFSLAIATAAFSEPRATSFSESNERYNSSPVASEHLEKSYVAAYALPLRWDLPDLNSGGVAANFKLGKTLALTTEFGGTFSEIFADYSARAGALWDGGSGFRLALEAESRTSRVKNYGSETIAWANFAAAIELTESIEIRGLIVNLNGASFRGGERSVRQTAAIGGLYEFSESFAFEGEEVIEIDADAYARAGVKWRAIDFIALRGIYATDGELRFGTDVYPTDNILIELNFERRPRLGVGSGVLVSYFWR